MFTGLIRAIGTVREATPASGGGLRLTIDASGLRARPEPGASVAVDGVCLTATAAEGARVSFHAVVETVARSTLEDLRPGDRVNLEPALCAGAPLDGHLVLGHVDGTARIVDMQAAGEGRLARISMPEPLALLVAAKGAIAVHGVSLTVVEAGRDWFSVALIPETLARTTLGNLAPGARVNLEADVLARYVARHREILGAEGGLTEEKLRKYGFG